MWTSKGRSGYGDSTIGGDYDSWDGVSPNGKQYKNEATIETRDLSGADYWHLRKQNRPTEEIPAELHMLNGKANIDVYGRLDEPKKPASKVPLKNRILPQSARVDKLRSEAIELEAAFKAGEFNPEEYTLLRNVQFKKLRRAEELLEKAITPVRTEDEFEEQSPQHNVEIPYATNYSFTNESVDREEPFAWLSSENSLKSILQKACKAIKAVVYWSNKAANYYRTLKEV